MGTNGLLHIHGGQVAEQHGSGAHGHLAERGDGKLERKAASIEHAVLHVLGDRAEMGVAGSELGPGVADADDRAALELVLGEAAVLEKRAVVEHHLVLPTKPGLTAQPTLLVFAHLFSPLKWGARQKGLRTTTLVEYALLLSHIIVLIGSC